MAGNSSQYLALEKILEDKLQHSPNSRPAFGSLPSARVQPEGNFLESGIAEMGYMPPKLNSMRKRFLVQFISFASAGAAGTLVQYALLFVLVEALSMHPVSSSMLGSLAGAVVNYLLSHHWVFRSQRKHSETATKFVAIAGLGLMLNAAIMYLLVTIAGVHYFLAQVAATGIVLFWNFLGNRFWTFADETGNA